MPLRSVKMKRFIFGFQRRVWCPKWTPLSSSCFMLTTAIAASLLCARPTGRASSVVAGTGWCAALASSGATHPAVARWDRGGDCPAGRREEDARSRPVGTGRTGQHTRGRQAVFPSGRRRPQIRGSPHRRAASGDPGSAACARRRPAALLLIVSAAVLAPTPRSPDRRRRCRRALDRAAGRRPGGDPAVRPAAARRTPPVTAAWTSAAPRVARCWRRATAWSCSPGWSPGGRW